MSQLRALASDGVLPPWSGWFGEDAMRELVPEERLRATLEEEMPRLPLSLLVRSSGPVGLAALLGAGATRGRIYGGCTSTTTGR